MFKQNTDFSIKHVYGECNSAADWLANISYSFSLGFINLII